MSDLDDILLEDETVIWQDRPAGPGTRRVSPGTVALVGDYVVPAIIFIFVWLGLCLWLLVETNLLAQLAIGAFAIALLAAIAVIVITGLKKRRERARSEPHYVLTSQRLVAWDATIDWRTQILPGAVEAVARHGRNLEIYIRSDSDALILYDLADIDTAERTITQALGRLT